MKKKTLTMLVIGLMVMFTINVTVVEARSCCAKTSCGMCCVNNCSTMYCSSGYKYAKCYCNGNTTTIYC
jgi:hypothetical protein